MHIFHISVLFSEVNRVIIPAGARELILNFDIRKFWLGFRISETTYSHYYSLIKCETMVSHFRGFVNFPDYISYKIYVF